MSPPIYTPDGNEVTKIVLPDGSTASEVVAPDGSVVFDAGPEIPDSVVDNFEASDADPAGVYESGETIADYYGGDTGSFSRQTGTVFAGSHAAQSPDTDTASFITSTSGLNRYPAKGEMFEYRLYIGGSNPGDSNGPSAIWGAPTEGTLSGYTFRAEPVDNRFRIRRYDSGSPTTLATLNSSPVTGEWMRITVDWQSDDDHVCTAYQSDGTEIGSISANDSTYADETGFGWLHNGNAAAQSFYDEAKIL